MESIFNYLQSSARDDEAPRQYHPLRLLDDRQCITYPRSRLDQATATQYQAVLHKFKTKLAEFKSGRDQPESLLKLLEATLMYVPSSTLPAETADISLYDHLKITAAVASCLYAYFASRGITDYRRYCYGDKAAEMRNEPAFLMVSGDISGVQGFIYTISSTGALRSLRGRSFYLELLLENIADELLGSAGLSRANLLYTGGGHFYLLLPAVREVEEQLIRSGREINRWFLRHFSTKLYLALAWEPCTAAELMGSTTSAGGGRRHTGDIFRALGEKLGRDKLRRYSPGVLKELADPDSELNELADQGRECQICRTSTSPVSTGCHFEKEVQLCRDCDQMMLLGGRLPEPAASAPQEKGAIRVLAVSPVPPRGAQAAVPVPSLGAAQDIYAFFQSMDRAESWIRSGASGVKRVYSLNRLVSGGPTATNLWAGTYAWASGTGEGAADFSELAAQSHGIERLAVLRADVDDLGMAFSRGFGRDPSGRSRSTLSRYAALSRWLSLFFKDHINDICRGELPPQVKPFKLFDPKSDSQTGGFKGRPLAISYAGGDDLFVVGAWDQVIEFAVDLERCWREFSQGRLTVSAGVGLFKQGFPVYRMAEVTAELEKAAKDADGKNSIALFGLEPAEENGYLVRRALHRYKWDEFTGQVCGEKAACLMRWFSFKDKDKGGKAGGDRLTAGTAFLYRLLELARERLGGERMPLAQLAYTVARREPKRESPAYQTYLEAKEKLYYWFLNQEQCRQLLTALYLVLYMNRRGEDD